MIETVSDRVRMKQVKLSDDGEKTLQLLQDDYGMEKEAAIRLMGSPLFSAFAVTKSNDQEVVALRSQNAILKGRVDALTGKVSDLQKALEIVR